MNGLIITWKGWVFTPGRMVDAMKENTKMIRNMVMVFTHGLIRDNIKGYGSEGNSMD